MRCGSAANVDATGTHRLLVELAPGIARVVRAVLRTSDADVDDVQQQALIAVVEALPSFRGECGPRHFASRIAVRVALKAARRARLERARCDGAPDVEELASTGGDSHLEAARQRRITVLRELLARLPAAQAETLRLRLALGWSLVEVAAATRVPVNTVRSRVRLGKGALRRAIESRPGIVDELELEG
ncbi:MAG: polymerase sigma-70 factor, subfamily [Labilithrix sp.]|nr:polymerase sigma-70 factor, subfamily [Labilithrix sp.]